MTKAIVQAFGGVWYAFIFFPCMDFMSVMLSSIHFGGGRGEGGGLRIPLNFSATEIEIRRQKVLEFMSMGDCAIAIQ